MNFDAIEGLSELDIESIFNNYAPELDAEERTSAIVCGTYLGTCTDTFTNRTVATATSCHVACEAPYSDSRTNSNLHCNLSGYKVLHSNVGSSCWLNCYSITYTSTRRYNASFSMSYSANTSSYFISCTR